MERNVKGEKYMDKLAINAIRVLAADMIQQADSGHPGLPLGAAPAAYTVWTREMKHNPGIRNGISGSVLNHAAGTAGSECIPTGR